MNTGKTLALQQAFPGSRSSSDNISNNQLNLFAF